MINTESRPISLSFCAARRVLGASREKDSTTAIRSSRANWERIERRPARYIFLLTLWVKFSSGVFGKVRPPPRHRGDDAAPARARPVPFWRQGFFLLNATCERSFWARVA